MKRLMIAAAIFACACSPPASEEAPSTAEPSLPSLALPISDRAGNRMEALTQTGERWCTGDGVWCIESREVSANFASGAPSIELPGEGELWPVIVRRDEMALVGLTTNESTPYSGGGSRATQLTLYEVANGAAREVLRMPYAASVMIRACFSEQDEQARAGACHDEYAFNTRISLDEQVAEGSPGIILETAAASYPGAITRTADSAARGALTAADLVWARDGECSFRRTYARGPDGLYAPDQALPPCADYLEP